VIGTSRQQATVYATEKLAQILGASQENAVEAI
jgi:hypothetical protein